MSKESRVFVLGAMPYKSQRKKKMFWSAIILCPHSEVQDTVCE